MAASDYATPAETSAAFKHRLRLAFPTVRFSVGLRNNSVMPFIVITWIDGPSVEMVDAETNAQRLIPSGHGSMVKPSAQAVLYRLTEDQAAAR